jgi:HAD superfamily hydrolase (TIGR01509 family)
MTAQYAGVLFDMDGVLVDTEQSVTDFWRRMARELRVTLSQHDFECHVYGRPADRTLDVLFPHASIDERRAVHAAMREHEIRDRYHAVRGVIAFLRALRRHSIPAALVTSGGPWKVDAVLSQLGIDDVFAARVTSSDVLVGKPDPECYLLGARMLGIPPQQCLVFEDAVSGVEAAVAAGAGCIGIARPAREQVLIAAGARSTIPDFSAVVYRAGTLALTNGVRLRVRAVLDEDPSERQPATEVSRQ